MKKTLITILIALAVIVVMPLIMAGCSCGGGATLTDADIATIRSDHATISGHGSRLDDTESAIRALEGKLDEETLAKLEKLAALDIDALDVLLNTDFPQLQDDVADMKDPTKEGSLAAEVEALKGSQGSNDGNPYTGEVTRWQFDSLYLDGGTITTGINRGVDRRYDQDADGLTWDYTSDPNRIEESDLYEITLIFYNEGSSDIELDRVFIELTLTPKDYCPINQDATYLDSDSSPYMEWDADFTLKTREGVEVCRRIVFTSDYYTVTIPAAISPTTPGVVSLDLVLELYY